ncbi:MAG: DUF262 domain-containing HNH endonuclease family protein [Phycisphaerales bacterium]
MNAHSMPFSKIISSDQGAREHYHVPKYQREYTWGKVDWERLLQDIDENDAGYFMGSIICVRDGDLVSPGDEVIFEVVDGQQRLTTLSLLMLAIYKRLSGLQEGLEFEDEEDRQEFQNSLSSLRNKLVRKKREGEYRSGETGGWIEQSKMCFLRVQPSSQNSNLNDYMYHLGDCGLIKAREKPRYLGVRLITRAYRFFLERTPEDTNALLALVAKINQLTFVHIAVNSQADAFTLFETLNNRGVPLSAIDIIKNKMLAEMERQHQVNIDESYERWQTIVAAVPDTTDQERFLRHFYNAFRWDPAVRVEGIPRAIKSKIIAIYERLIKQGAQSLFDRLCDAAEIYGNLIAPDAEELPERLTRELAEQLAELDRINATPAHQVLLYLLSLEPSATESGFMGEAVDLLQRYYVRRNVTDVPGTRDLDQAHMELVEACQQRLESGERLTAAFFRSKLFAAGRYASLDTFRNALLGPMYSSNILMTRFLLVKLDETQHTREYRPDLWARNDADKYIWTVEHVLPQTPNISDEWAQMLASGDAREASRLHEQHVDRLGNLTLSGYNSKLAAAPFEKKQALATQRKVLGHPIDIGYRNRLALNRLAFPLAGSTQSLATASAWTADAIEARTGRMAEMLVSMYRVEGID